MPAAVNDNDHHHLAARDVLIQLSASIREISYDAAFTASSLPPDAPWPAIARLSEAGRDILSLALAMSVIARRSEGSA